MLNAESSEITLSLFVQTAALQRSHHYNPMNECLLLLHSIHAWCVVEHLTGWGSSGQLFPSPLLAHS